MLRQNKDLYYLAFCDKQYRDYVVFQFFQEASVKMTYVDHVEQADPSFLKKQTKKELGEVFEKFTD